MHAFTVPVLIVAAILSGWWLLTTLRDSENPMASKVIASVLFFLSFSAIAIHFTIGITAFNTVEMAGKNAPEQTIEQKAVFEKALNAPVVVIEKTEAAITVEKANKRVEELKAKTDKETLDSVTEETNKQLEKLLQ